MKKYKKMVLAGILLSSTILGANTSVVQAASTSNKLLNVDTSEFKDSVANNVIQVINDLLNSSSTANKVNSQTKFSDLKDGETMHVAPIFGEKDSSDFEKVLKGELNVVDDSEQLVPMKVVKSNENGHGFINQVSYTLDGTTKTVSVNYNYAKPTVSFDGNQVMNFKRDNTSNANDVGDDIDTINSYATDIDSVSVNTNNGNDAKGNKNETNVTTNGKVSTSDIKPVTIAFTPSDSYVPLGISANRTVNLYAAPDWSNVPGTVSNVDDFIKQPMVINNKNNQLYKVSIANSNVDSGKYDLTATAIDSKGNEIRDNSTNNPITYTNTLAISSDTTESNYYPTAVYKDPKSGNIVYTYNFGKKTDSDKVISSSEVQNAVSPLGYTVTKTSLSDFDFTNKNFKEYFVTKDAPTIINFKSIDDDYTGSTTLTGNNGDKDTLNAPNGYRLVNPSDRYQTLNADQPTKDIYIQKLADSDNALSYTVTFRNKDDRNQVVGTEVKGTGSFGNYVNLTAPSGYAFASILDNGFILLKNNQNVTKYVVAADTPYNISYVDQDTGKEVDTQTGKGANGAKIVLKAPTGYAFVSADDVNYKIDKDTPKSTVYVQKSNQTEDNIVSGYPKNGYIKIYDKNGKLNNDVVLSEGSSWIIDQQVSINGSEYYRVATNEYVKASDVYKYTPLQTVATTNGKDVTPVCNSRGQVIIDRALDTNTPWYTDRSATIRGQKMYRVATDEWIKASDSTLK